MAKFKVKLTYEVEVECDHITNAISSARGRVERPRTSYDTDPYPDLTACEALRVEDSGK